MTSPPGSDPPPPAQAPAAPGGGPPASSFIGKSPPLAQPPSLAPRSSFGRLDRISLTLRRVSGQAMASPGETMAPGVRRLLSVRASEWARDEALRKRAAHGKVGRT